MHVHSMEAFNSDLPTFIPEVIDGKRRLIPNLLPKQSLYFYSDKKEVILVGGVGAGKTRVACISAISDIMRSPGYDVLMTEPTYKDIRLILYEMIEEVLIDMGFPSSSYYLNKSTHECIFPGLKNKIIFRSTDDPTSIKGFQVGSAYLDELDRQNMTKAREAHMNVGLRVRYSRQRAGCRHKDVPPTGQIRVSTTPEGKGRFCHNYFVENANPIRQDIFFSSTLDNPFLDDGYVDHLMETLSPELRAQYILGEFVDSSFGAVYKYFKKDMHVVDDVSIDRSKPLYITCDFNVSPCVFLFVQSEGGYHDTKGAIGIDTELFKMKDAKVRVIDEISANNTTTQEMAIELIDRLRNMGSFPSIIINGDPAGNSRSTQGHSDYTILEQAFQESGIHYEKHVPRAAPLVRDRINAVNSLISKNKVIIHKRCKYLIGDMIKVAWNENGDVDKKSDLTLTHAADAFGYHIHRYFRIISIRRGQSSLVVA